MIFIFLIISVVIVFFVVSLIKVFNKNTKQKLMFRVIFILTGLIIITGILGFWHLFKYSSPVNATITFNWSIAGSKTTKEFYLPKGNYIIEISRLNRNRAKDLQSLIHYTLETPAQNLKINSKEKIRISSIADGNRIGRFEIKNDNTKIIFSVEVIEPCEEEIQMNIFRIGFLDDM